MQTRRPSRALSRRVAPTALAALLFGACGEVTPGDQAGPGEGPPPPPTFGTLETPTTPASWQGDLPCASCDAVRVTLTLSPDGSFRRENAYLGLAPEGDTLFGEVGRWVREASGARVSLHGSTEPPVSFAVDAAGGLRMLDTDGQEIVSAPDYTLRPLPQPNFVAGPIRLTGAFTYLADSALLVECQSGVQLPVAMTEPYLPLETLYLSRGLGGAPLRVRVRARIEQVPAMEGTGTESALVLDAFEGEEGGAACPALDLREALAGGPWRLSALEGEPALAVPVGAETPTLAWDPVESRLTGSAGCNAYTGRGALRGSLLVTSELALTRRFCEGAMELEGRVSSLLTGGGWLRLEEGALLWHVGPDVRARFTRG